MFSFLKPSSLSLSLLSLSLCLTHSLFLSLQHRDLAARNVLLDKTMTCRVGDFGLSVDLAEKDEDESGFYAGSEGGKIPVRWTAIEAICFRQFSSASDVWSFGILLWEIWSYAEVSYISQERLFYFFLLRTVTFCLCIGLDWL